MSLHSIARELVSIGCASLLAACASTEVSKVWKDEARGTQPIGKVLVIAVAPSATTRDALEDEFVAQLKARGHDAQALHTMVRADTAMDRAKVVELVKAQSIPTILVTRLVQKKTVESQVPAAARPLGYYGTFNDYYRTTTSFASSPAYSIEHEVVVMETNLYDGQSEKLFWSARSDTFMGDSAPTLIRSFVEVTLGEMDKSKLL